MEEDLGILLTAEHRDLDADLDADLPIEHAGVTAC